MSVRRPLVVVSGVVKELPTGDTLPPTGTFPFYNAAGVRDDINLTSSGKLPFYKSTGAASDIPLVIT